MSARLREIVVTFDVFYYDFYFVVGPSKKLARYLSKRQDQKLSKSIRRVERVIDGAHGVNFHRRGHPPVIWMPAFNPAASGHVDTLTHEMFHAVLDVMKEIGMPLRKASEEAYAYAIGNGVGQVLKKWRAR